jgi:hypothetical protein
MDYRVVFPTFPKAPAQYDARYFDDLTRALDSLVTVIRAAGEGRQTTIVLTNLQGNDSGLEPGTIFQVDGALRIPILYKPYVAGQYATGRVGSVTVTT